MMVLRMLSPIGKGIDQIALVNAKATSNPPRLGVGVALHILDAIAIGQANAGSRHRS